MSQIAPTAATAISNLQSSLQTAYTFNTTSIAASLNTGITSVDTALLNFKNGNTPDITDVTSIASLIAVASRSQVTSACTGVWADSWVVSLGNTSFTSCALGGGASVNFAGGCNTQAKVQGNNAACVGCVDTTDILTNIYAAAARGVLLTDLNAKYTAAASAACMAPFNSFFGNVWDNYYFVKISTASDPNVNFPQIYTRWTAAKTSANLISGPGGNLATLNTTMSTVMTTLSASVDSITNPTYGMIAGLNCLVIGQDLNNFVSTICVSNFITIYITRQLMGISSFAILFALCCIVCSGVRHYKHG
jgi:hypothetical protein